MTHWLLKCTVKEDGRRTATIDQGQQCSTPTTAALLNINQFLWREDHEQATDRECHWLCLPYPGDGCRSPNLLRRSLESRLRYTTRKLRSDLQFLSEHKRRRCHASQSGEVQRGCRKIGRGSRVGDGPRQIRVRFGKAGARLRRRDLERPRRRRALLGILDRATKQLGRPLSAISVSASGGIGEIRAAPLW
jgi:hypothetical protein